MRPNRELTVAPLWLMVLYISAASLVNCNQFYDDKPPDELDISKPAGLLNEERMFEGTDDDEAILARHKRSRNKSTNQLPEFASPINNVTAVLGRDVRLVCTVDNLGSYSIWLPYGLFELSMMNRITGQFLRLGSFEPPDKANSLTIRSSLPRQQLVMHEEERKWVLHIKDVQESDRGFYQCQVNTNPMRSISGYLDVVVPPTILESQTTQVIETTEHSNVSLQCRANGAPKPTISWRRDDGLPLRLTGQLDPVNPSESQTILPILPSDSSRPSDQSAHMLNEVRSEKLQLANIDRSMAGLYVCSAANTIPGPATKKVPLYVKFAPQATIRDHIISVNDGEQLEVDCLIEAFPNSNNYWSKTSSPAVSMASLGSGSTLARGRTFQRRRPPPNSSPNLKAPRTNSAHAWKATDNDNQSAGTSSLLSARVAATERDSINWSAQISGRQLERELINEGADPRMEKTRTLDRDEIEPEVGEDLLVVDKPTAVSSESAARLQRQTGSSSRELFRTADEQTGEPGLTHNWSIGRDHVFGSGGGGGLNTGAAANLLSVKQTVVNSYTYRLRLTIGRMQPADFGVYTCVASNSMGHSEAQILVRRIERPSSRSQDDSQQGAEYIRPGQPDEGYLRDELDRQRQLPAAKVALSSSQRSRPVSSNTAVYDEKYLQAIKIRQNGNSIKHQRLKSVHSSATRSLNKLGYCKPSLIIGLTLIANLLSIWIWNTNDE